ncbi:hypothetical protein [Amycolatopsis sp. lyj-23]|uniref:hypothetical protein n=1 Tax=Amycolatopsis sp. lyj-23 TaxID=2789283 RepID=UPI00397E76D8
MIDMADRPWFKKNDSREAKHTEERRRLAVKAGLGLPSSYHELGQKYADISSNWQRKGFGDRITLFGRYWEIRYGPPGRGKPIDELATQTAKYQRNVPQWEEGRSRFIEILVEEFELKQRLAKVAREAAGNSELVHVSADDGRDSEHLAVATCPDLIETSPSIAASTERSWLSRISRSAMGYVRQRRMLTFASCAYLLFTGLAVVRPLTISQPWLAIDNWSPDLQGIFGLIWSIAVTATMVALSYMYKAFRAVLAVLLLATCTQVIGHWVVFYADTRQAASIAASAANGATILAEEFPGKQQCSAAILLSSLPPPSLTSCTFDNGALHLLQNEPYNTNIGIYAPDDLALNPSGEHYMETRFRPGVATPYAACGIAAAGIASYYYYFFRLRAVRLTSGKSGYIAEILSIMPGLHPKDGSAGFEMKEYTMAVTATSLPFVLRWSLPGSDDSQIKLGVLFHRESMDVFVDDRLVLSSKGSVFGTTRMGPAVNPKTAGNFSGTASCDFDYFRVQQLQQSP